MDNKIILHPFAIGNMASKMKNKEVPATTSHVKNFNIA
jgi:hypothetical protein